VLLRKIPFSEDGLPYTFSVIKVAIRKGNFRSAVNFFSDKIQYNERRHEAGTLAGLEVSRIELVRVLIISSVEEILCYQREALHGI
jgi:hypothetical protein